MKSHRIDNKTYEMFNCENQLVNYRDENTYDISDYKNKRKKRQD